MNPLDERPHHQPRRPRSNRGISLTLIAIASVTIAFLASQQQATDTELHEQVASEAFETQVRVAAAEYELLGSDPTPALEGFREIATTDEERTRAALAWSAFACGEHERAREDVALEIMAGVSNAPDTVTRAIEKPTTLSESERAELVAAYGVTAELAVVHEDPLVDGERPEPWPSIVQGAMTVLGIVVFYVVAFFAGVLGLLRFRKRLRTEKIARFSEAEFDADIYLEALAVFLIASCASRITALTFAEAPWLPFLSLFDLAVLPVAVFWPAIRGVPWQAVRADLGLHRGAGFMREIGAGIAGYALLLPVFATGALVTMILERIVQASNEDAVMPTHPDAVGLSSPAEWILFIVMAAVVAPLVEEILFRGALYRGFRKTLSPIMSAILVAVIFALVHPQGWIAVPALTALAIGFAGVREWRDSLIAPIVAHALHNSLLLAILHGLSG